MKTVSTRNAKSLAIIGAATAMIGAVGALPAAADEIVTGAIRVQVGPVRVGLGLGQAYAPTTVVVAAPVIVPTPAPDIVCREAHPRFILREHWDREHRR